MKITSCGILRNEERPRVGIMAANNGPEWLWDDIESGIDLTYENFLLELEDQGLKEDSEKWNDETENYCSDSRIMLFGDAWKKNKKTKSYEIDKSKEYAATYNSDTNIICVEWSKYTMPCNHTSPCYVMSNGDGPCADLDSQGKSVIGYCLPRG